MKTKRMLKAGFAIVMCSLMIAMSCVSAFAADYTTKTEYVGTEAAPMVTVTATATNVNTGDYVTYVAYKDALSEDSVVHINQGISDANNNGTITFEYSTGLDNIGTTKVFGGTTSGVGNSTVNPTVTDQYTASLVVGSTTSTVYFDKYAENVTPYPVAREFAYSGGAVSDVKVGDTSVDFVVTGSSIVMYTDLINAEGLTITVTTAEPADTKVWLGEGTAVAGANGNIITINAKTDVNPTSEYGVLVSKNNQFANITALSAFDGTIDDETVAFPALGKNEDGVFAVQFEGFEDGECYFAAYVKAAGSSDYIIDVLDADGEAIQLAFN